ncbi:MAG TPA: sugar phosphate isomerase/epimerase [bacterium]|nr:sugar phosphate isomerase/epimerase [bacterium]HPP11213.1 sugar phosphate isomerase/epimerase [bacterium]
MKLGTQLGAIKGDSRPAVLKRARQLGCQGLEVGLAVSGIHTGTANLEELLHQARQMRTEFQQAGMEVISLTPGIILKHVQHPAVIKAVGEVAAALGVRQIRMFFSPHVRLGGPGSQLNEWLAEFDGTKDSRYWMKRDSEYLQELLRLSQGFNLRYVFELHHGYVVNSASGAMRLLEHHPVEKVGILMDPGNMVFEGNEGWRNSVQIMGEYLAYLHCKNSRYVYRDGRWHKEWACLAEGIADYGEIITALKDINFTGYLSVEDLRGHLSDEERIGQGIAYLKSLVESQDRVMPV